MVARIHTVTFEGLRVTDVNIQVQMASGLPAFQIVGLPDKAVGESRERVRAAIHALGLSLPAKRITINLSPADLQKEGSHFDLPIALGILVAMGVIPADAVAEYIVMGEMALDGAILPVSGVLPAAMSAVEQGLGIICPATNGQEARWSAQDIAILAPATLLALINHFKGTQILSEIIAPTIAASTQNHPDMAMIRGQAAAKRALEITAAGGHNLLMSGPPGSGKSMLAACLPGILPPLTSEEILSTSMIASVAGKLADGKLCTSRPFRDPHHSASQAAMVGGGRKPLPGEISLAHNGVLFLDEIPEFPRGVLESLRQPLETGEVSVARAQAHVTYPARFQLIAAMNPCRCGYLSDAGRACNRAPQCAVDYQAKLSGPFLDRIDIHIDVPELSVSEMFTATTEEPSATIAARVARARDIQRTRYEHMRDVTTNRDLKGEQVMQVIPPEPEGMALAQQAAEKLNLSMRALHRVFKVARTIADLAESETIQRNHVAEALNYRQRHVLRANTAFRETT